METPTRSQTRSSAPNQISPKPKRFQACISCRTTKTKCLPSARPGTCQACLKSSRPCVMPGPAKPRMKSAQKFSELEKKIEMLTNALAGQDRGSLLSGDDSTSATTLSNTEDLRSPETTASTVSHVDDENDVTAHSYKHPVSSDVATGLSIDELDIVADGTITHYEASSLYLHWKNNMQSLIPFILLDVDISLDQIRNHMPTLFLAIATVASTAIYPHLSARLVPRLTTEFGTQIFVRNTQSVDLVLAILVFSHYHFQPGPTTNLSPSRYIQAAIAVSSDLGLVARARGINSSSPESAREAARLCLNEWFAASAMATILHRKSLIRHSPDLEKYASELQSQQPLAYAWPLSQLKLQEILERASLLINSSENKSDTAFDDSSTQYKLNLLQNQLDDWERDVPDSVDNRLKQYSVHTSFLYIHEIAVRCFVRKLAIQKKNGWKQQSKQDDGMMGLTPLHFDCLSKCLDSLKASLDIYLSFDTAFARCLPNRYLYWNISAAVLLIKLGHFGDVVTKAQSPSSRRSTAQPESFKEIVVYYLDTVAAKMEEISRDGYLPQAKPYIKVLRKFKPYYLQKRSVCINSQGDAVVMECDDAPGDPGSIPSAQDDARGSMVPAKMSQVHLPDSLSNGRHTDLLHRQPASTMDRISHTGWTPSSNVGLSDTLPTPAFSGSYQDQLGSPAFNINAAYDPSTYASTDWDNLTLDAEAIQQLDSFMFMEDDNMDWMQSLL